MRYFTAALTLCVAVSTACPAAANYYDTHLLTKADVELYLRVMTQAATRADALRAKQKPCPKQPEIKKNHLMTPAEIKALTDAINCIAGAGASAIVDDDIAKNDPHYLEVKDAIESLIQPNRDSRDGVGPIQRIGGCGAAEAWDCAPPDWTPAMKAKFAAQDRFAKQNGDFLEPYRPQIQQLETRVRRIGEEQPANPFAPPPGRQPAPYHPPKSH